MQFVYKPEGVDPIKWDFAPDRLMNVEAEAIERATKMTYAEWGVAVGKGSMTALHGLLWVLLKRKDPTLQWDAVQFSLSDIDFELDDDESAEALADYDKRIAAGEELDPSELAAVAQLRTTVQTSGAEQNAEGDGPKED